MNENIQLLKEFKKSIYDKKWSEPANRNQLITGKYFMTYCRENGIPCLAISREDKQPYNKVDLEKDLPEVIKVFGNLNSNKVAKWYNQFPSRGFTIIFMFMSGEDRV